MIPKNLVLSKISLGQKYMLCDPIDDILEKVKLLYSDGDQNAGCMGQAGLARKEQGELSKC